MIDFEVGSAYGKTLFLALKHEELKQAVSDFEKALHSLKREPLASFLASPIVPFEKKEAIFKSEYQGKMLPALYDFILFVIRKGRAQSLPLVLRDFMRRVHDEEGELSATITTAAPLSEAQREELLAKLKKTFHQELKLQEIVDPKILGGAILRAGHNLWDGSVHGQLSEMKSRLLEVKP